MLRRIFHRCGGGDVRPARATTSLGALEASDLAAIHKSLAIGRLRTAVLAATALPIIEWITGLEVVWAPVALIALLTSALNPLYNSLHRRGVNLRRLIYTELGVSTLAITLCLNAMGPPSLLFGYVYLVVVVPATMVSGLCGAAIGVLSAICFGELVLATPLDTIRAASGTTHVAVLGVIFGLVGHQCFFYKKSLREKNEDLAASSERLREASAALAVTAETALGLLEVGRVLGSSLEPGALIDQLHTVVLDRLRTDWCATLVPDARERSGHRLVVTRDLSPAALRDLRTALAPLASAAGPAEVLELPAGGRHAVARALAAAGFGTAFVTPIPSRGGPCGLLATGYHLGRAGTFTALQRDFAAGIATQAGIAIENALLHAQLAEEAEVSASLLQVAELLNAHLDTADRTQRLAVLAREVTGVDFLNLLLCDPEQRVFRVIAGSHPRHPAFHEELLQLDFSVDEYPIFAEVTRTGWVEGRGDAPRDPLADSWVKRWGIRSFATAALTLRGQAIGAFFVGWHEQGGPIAAKTRRLLTGIAQQTAIAVENSRLVENLRSANALKTEFISTISHELRTPLNAIIGYNELLAEGEFGPMTAGQSEACSKVLGASRQLLELIQSTLDVSRIESGTMPVSFSVVEPGSLLGEIVAQVPAAWVKTGVALRMNVDSHLPAIETDRAKLTVVIRNLVHNALKFTEQGAVEVRATVVENNTLLEVTVSDTGIGISPADQVIIFDMFRQVDGSDRRRHDGVGLGLFIVQRLVTLLGGTVRVTSEVGRGSTFVVRVPLATGRAPAADAPRHAAC